MTVFYNPQGLVLYNSSDLENIYFGDQFIVIRKDSPVFSDGTIYLHYRCHRLEKCNKVDFINLYGTRMYYLDKVREAFSTCVIPLYYDDPFPARIIKQGTFDVFYHYEEFTYAINAWVSEMSEIHFTIASRGDEDRELDQLGLDLIKNNPYASNLLTYYDCRPKEKFIEIPEDKYVTLEFKYGYVCFSNGESFIDENGEVLQNYYDLSESRITFKVKRNPNAKYAHNILHYVYVAKYSADTEVTLIVNQYQSKVNVKPKSTSNKDYIIVFFSTIKSCITIDRKRNYYDIIYKNDEAKKVDGELAFDNVTCMMLNFESFSRGNPEFIINNTIQTEAIIEYKNATYGYENVEVIKDDVKVEFSQEEETVLENGIYNMRITETVKTYVIKEGYSVAYSAENFQDMKVITKSKGVKRDLIAENVLHVDFTNNGKLELSYVNSVHESAYITIYVYKTPHYDCQNIISFGTAKVELSSNKNDDFSLKQGKDICLTMLFSFSGTTIKVDVNKAGISVTPVFDFSFSKSIRSDEYDKPILIKVTPPENGEEASLNVNVENPNVEEKPRIVSKNSEYKSEQITYSEKVPDPEPEPEKNPEPEPEKNPGPEPEKNPGPEPEKNPEPNPKDDEQNAEPTPKPVNGGLIAGVIIGVLVVIAIIVIAILFLIKKRKSANEPSEGSIEKDDMPDV
ncbi:hypothetical protein TVAG_046680 [Trichomonas vaginalis G3]|uniref:Uncharacterized protein n=1 Tax=Trichomonas vaginalis (strain ATCC PRA-98 / G3) TaxID=412133 RepID=A2EAP3_TRIV3|nr:hypothetical protein TVAGG3_0958410 [Trichomonas vaginalis G3]EAY10246.1 hypothetical protein TVAG_046680 [Trichomonas vaginalis G3]KAI5487728.1 hypothetical protein TVAGG3_0958410 [Trichomonas vaginalis G3]|eukprot:XP_001322469.1 hypothetical protein [Trichomonas vaginalis G3]